MERNTSQQNFGHVPVDLPITEEWFTVDGLYYAFIVENTSHIDLNSVYSIAPSYAVSTSLSPYSDTSLYFLQLGQGHDYSYSLPSSSTRGPVSSYNYHNRNQFQYEEDSPASPETYSEKVPELEGDQTIAMSARCSPHYQASSAADPSKSVHVGQPHDTRHLPQVSVLASGEYADQPDLYPSYENPVEPPPGNMSISKQDLRSNDDLYTPTFIRGVGPQREGWCGFCRPGRWLRLKGSPHWNHKMFEHGICAATGKPFNAPLEKRLKSGGPAAWEVKCGTCNEWIGVTKKSKVTPKRWFKHAYRVNPHWFAATRFCKPGTNNFILVPFSYRGRGIPKEARYSTAYSSFRRYRRSNLHLSLCWL